MIDGCNGCDVLIHEVYSMMTYNAVSPAYQEYRRKHHTSSSEVAEIAKKALLEEVRKLCGGKVVIGHDLDVF